MEKIASFTVNHLNLLPGVYVSRKDNVGGNVITTFDLRMTRPNYEPVMNTAEVHTIEHLAATFLRNHKDYGDKIIYMEGVIVAVDDCSISVDLKGRLGFFKAPKRMFICDTEPKVGQEVGWNMSFPEQLGPEVNEKYVSNIEKERRKQQEMQARLDANKED